MTYDQRLDQLRQEYRAAKTDSDRALIKIRAWCLKLAQEKSGQNQYKTAKEIFGS